MNKELRKYIDEDTYRYFGSDRRPFLYKWRVRPLKYTITLRKFQYYEKNSKKIRRKVNALKLRMYSPRYLIQIPASTKIGRGLYIGHLGSVIINPNATMGDNINLGVGVTIGQTNRGPKKGSPTIGNKVWIGTNAA